MLSKRGRGGKGSWQVSRVVARDEASNKVEPQLGLIFGDMSRLNG